MRIAFFNRGAPPPGPNPTKAGPCFAGPGPIARVIRRAPPRNDLDKSQQFKRIKRKPGTRIETGQLPEAPKRPAMRARRGRGGRGRRDCAASPRPIRFRCGFASSPAKRAAPRANSSLSARAPPDRFSPHEKAATEKHALRAPAPPTQYFIRAMRQFRDDANCFSILKIERLTHCAWASRPIDRADRAIPIGSVRPTPQSRERPRRPEPCPGPGRTAIESGPRALESSLRQPQEPRNQRTEASAEGGANEKGSRRNDGSSRAEQAQNCFFRQKQV